MLHSPHESRPTSHWASALESIPDTTNIRRSLYETKQQRNGILEALDLPRYSMHTGTLSEFMSAPDSFLDVVHTPSIWFQVVPPDATQKITCLDVEKSQAADKIRDVSLHFPTESFVLVSEYLHNKYGGNVTVNDTGQLFAEFGEGVQTDFASRNITPTCRLSTNAAGTVEYSFEDPSLRQACWETIKALRSDGAFLPGYFEFALCEDDNTLRPIFLDAILSDKNFTVPSEILENIQK